MIPYLSLTILNNQIANPLKKHISANNFMSNRRVMKYTIWLYNDNPWKGHFQVLVSLICCPESLSPYKNEWDLWLKLRVLYSELTMPSLENSPFKGENYNLCWGVWIWFFWLRMGAGRRQEIWLTSVGGVCSLEVVDLFLILSVFQMIIQQGCEMKIIINLALYPFNFKLFVRCARSLGFKTELSPVQYLLHRFPILYLLLNQNSVTMLAWRFVCNFISLKWNLILWVHSINKWIPCQRQKIFGTLKGWVYIDMLEVFSLQFL